MGERSLSPPPVKRGYRICARGALLCASELAGARHRCPPSQASARSRPRRTRPEGRSMPPRGCWWVRTGSPSRNATIGASRRGGAGDGLPPVQQRRGLIAISAEYDAHRDDPLAEGGYAPDALAASVVATVAALGSDQGPPEAP